jgi:putative transposase
MKKVASPKSRWSRSCGRPDKAPVAEVARRHKVSAPAIYPWGRRFGVLQPAGVKRLRWLEAGNAKLKKLVAERDLEIETMKKIGRPKW